MAEEGMKREGTELLGLPPRKRFKMLEQQRRKEIQQEDAPSSHCSDITNVMPQHRVSPKKLTSQGFLVLEKQKYKLQQQKLQENLAPAMPPLPPRPVAVKRKEAPALPLPTPPAMRLKFQGEKVHSPSSSAFKSWGNPSLKKTIKFEPAPVVPKSNLNPRKDQAQKPKRHQQETMSAPPQPKTWTMAKGTTCSINKAQEDVEMLNSEMLSSEDDVMVSTSTTSSLDLNVAAEGDNIGQMDNMAEAFQVAEIVTIPAPVLSLTEDAIQDVEDVAADLACSVLSEDVSHAPLANTSVEAAYVEDPQANDDEEIVETAMVPTLGFPIEQTADLSGAEESTVADVSEALVALQALEVAPEADAPTPEVPETCSSPLATGSTTVAESHTDSEASNTSNIVEDLTAAPADNEEKTLPVPCDETCSARKDEEKAVTDESELQEGKGAPLKVTEGGYEHETDMEQDGLLAELDERAEKLFKRMFEREGCEDEDDESDAQFFFASNGVNNFNSLVVDMEVDQDITRPSTSEQKNGVGRGDNAASLDEDHQVVLDRSTVDVPNKPPEEEEKPESSSRFAEDSDLESEHPVQETICKSSKEASDWDLEMDVPDFGLGKRSGAMTQRVKAPGRWSQSAQDKASNETYEEEDEDEDEEGACDVCRSADAKPSDPIVYCDGCDIPVHADCYGAPLSNKIPEGDWFCAQCQSKRPDSRNCCLCPRSGGVMKMTTDGNWAHLSCAVFVPEVFFRNADDMEGIDASHVPSKRYLAKCCVCKKRGGACVDCTETGCKSRFHVSCALKKDLAMEFRNGRNGAIVISFCQEHTAAWDEQQERKGRSKYKIVSREPQKPKVFQRSKSR